MPVIDFSQAIIPTLACGPLKLKEEFVDRLVPGHLLEVRSTSPGQGTWRYRQKVDGRMLHTKLGTTDSLTLAESRKKARALRAAYDRGDNPYEEAKARKAMITLDEFWLAHYLPYATPRKKSIKRDHQIFRLQIQPTLGKLKMNAISRQQIQSLATLHRNNGLSAASADHVSKLCRRLFSLAVQWEIVEKNPASRIELFNEDNQVEHYLDDEQLQRLVGVLKTYPSRNVALICMFLLATGCRVNEALTAQWNLVNRQNRIWRVAASNSKSGKSRAVPLSDSAIDVLDQIGTEGEFDFVFINQDTGKPYTHIRHTWIRIRERAGMPWLRLHDLRHSFASMLVNAGCSLFVVQQALGHADSRVTQRYSHLSGKTLQDAANSASLKIKEALKQVA